MSIITEAPSSGSGQALQVYQVPHVDGVFRLHPPLREGEHPLQAPRSISVWRYPSGYWRCGQCWRKASATIPCIHIRQVQEYLKEKL